MMSITWDNASIMYLLIMRFFISAILLIVFNLQLRLVLASSMNNSRIKASSPSEVSFVAQAGLTTDLENNLGEEESINGSLTSSDQKPVQSILDSQVTLKVALAPPPTASQNSVVYSFPEFEKLVLERHPQLSEDSLEILMAQQKYSELKTGAILPRFEFQMAMGPAPGLHKRWDTSFVYQSRTGGLAPFYTRSGSTDYDFSTWGPYMGMEFKAAQPLNFYRFKSGLKASRMAIKVAEKDVQKKHLEASYEAFRIYFGYLFAQQMFKETAAALKDMNKALQSLQEKIDEGDESVSQKDLLELKSNLFKLESGHHEAQLQKSRAELGASFYCQLNSQNTTLPLLDTLLNPLAYPVPTLDSAKKLTLLNHPDLKKLEHGLKARSELLQIARGELGPDLFIFAGFNYTKTWSSKRESQGDIFASDPLNDIGGVVGLGITQKLNFWNRYQNFHKKTIELNQLKRKELYAARGLVMLTHEAFLKWTESQQNMISAEKSLKAAEAWLKGAAMQYDLDPSNAKDLISPYKQTLSAKRDYYNAVFEYNLSYARLLHSMGLTLNQWLSQSQQTASP